MLMQPPSGGCVLKLKAFDCLCRHSLQPPSGGCVLKHEVGHATKHLGIRQPPSGGCVLKLIVKIATFPSLKSSRLRAAVC